MERRYKDSGIEWIGKIPDTWEVDIAKHVFKQRRDKGNDECQLLAATQKYGMYPQHLLEGVVKVAADTDLKQFKTVHKNDYVISLRSFQGGFEMSDYEGVCSPAYQVFYATRQISSQYYKYLFKADAFIQEINALTVGIREGKNILYDDFALIPIPIPAASEQQRIADYLDEKCGEIDSLIGLQEQMIEKLKAYKQSVITEAVTKGLNPNAKLVPSGIDWIGDIPSHWDIIKIGFIFINMDCLREPISAELRERNNPQYDYYGASGIIDKIDHYNVEDKVLLIGEDGANLVMRNLPLIYKAEGKFWVNNHAHILKPRKDNYDFMAHALEACNYRDYITGSAQPKLSQENLSRVQLPVPPLEEQQAVASYLDEKCSEIDNLIAVKQQKIEKLKDYKKSVIYEAVTGKTDLREKKRYKEYGRTKRQRAVY